MRIFADAHVKHGAHAIVADRRSAELTRDLEFFDADAVIATGQRTGDAADLDEMRTIREAPRPAGPGRQRRDARQRRRRSSAVVDGVIVASSLKRDGVWWNEVDPDRVAAFMAEVRRLA